jgi:hypothetical protein
MANGSNITPLVSAGSAPDAQQEMFELEKKSSSPEIEGELDMLITSMIDDAMASPVYENDKAAIRQMTINHVKRRQDELQIYKHEVLEAATPLLIEHRVNAKGTPHAK